MDVELWLHTLTFAPGTRSKIHNIMSAVFNHAIRHEWMDRNPITKVRTSAKRLREPDVLSPAEITSLLAELNLRERAMVMLAGSTGLRRSGLVALTWSDIDLELMQGTSAAPVSAITSETPKPKRAANQSLCTRPL